MVIAKAIAPPEKTLDKESINETLYLGLHSRSKGQRVLVLIPDYTRSLPLPLLFRLLVNILQGTRQLDFMVALGTHPPLSENRLYELVGIDPEDRENPYKKIAILNHAWSEPEALKTIGVLKRERIKKLAGEFWHPSLDKDIPVRVNKAALEYDHLIILGPTFPHEVAGFSGGAKYLFPGISGPEIINATHWLGALVGILNIMGCQDTPVRRMIQAAAAMIPIATTLVALVVDGKDLAGIFIGDLQEAWEASASLSAKRHIHFCNHSYPSIFSCPSTKYDELWTAAKAVYKLAPVIEKGGEIIIFAPHLRTVSHVHGHYIFQVGYHILPYFLQNWSTYKNIPLGVLAHLTHLRGSGSMENGGEMPDYQITLASKISEEDCIRLNLGYLDPKSIDPSHYINREQDGILYVPDAGEILYRLKSPSTTIH